MDEPNGNRASVSRCRERFFITFRQRFLPTRGFELNVASVMKSAKHLTWTWGIVLVGENLLFREEECQSETTMMTIELWRLEVKGALPSSAIDRTTAH